MKIDNREKTLNKINEINEHFTELGFECKKEVKTNFNRKSNPADIFENRTNLVDIICRRDKQVFMFEIENSQYNQCLKNIRAMKQAKNDWEKLGLDVSICSLGTDEPLSVCENIPKKDVINPFKDKTINERKINRKNSYVIPRKRLIGIGW